MKGIMCSGGIGDMIMAIPLVLELEKCLDEEQTIWCDHPEVFDFFLKRKVKSRKELFEPCTLIEHKSKIWDWDYLIHITNMAWFVHGWDDYNAMNRWGWPEAIRLCEFNKNFIREHNLQHYIDFHPKFDGGVASIMMQKGLNRRTLPQAMLGINPLPLSTPVDLDQDKPYKIYLGDNYITLHCGFGLNHEGKVQRATKQWDISYYAELVEMFKLSYPGLNIVQLGNSKTSKKIPGVDYCFLDLDLSSTFYLLSESQLHIDGDSGLVHAATAMGVKCIVMFGPTPAQYFGYPENVNLQMSIACSGCWWSTDDWMSKCPEGNPTPHCMDLIFPSSIMKEIEKIF